MIFSYSIGLLAIAGILVPLTIHLWNVKEGKTLKIGSVALLGESSKQSSKSLKVKDWLLLLLRCLLIVLIAFIIAQPFINKKVSKKADSGWIVIKKRELRAAYHQDKKSIDALLTKGYELHDFNVGFAILNLSDTAAETTSINSISAISLIKQLDAQLPSGYQLQLYYNGLLNDMEEELPNISIALHLKTLPLKDTTIQKVAAAYWSNRDSIKVLMMSSNAQSTKYDLKNYLPQDKDLLSKTEDGELFLKAKDQSDFVKVASQPIEISVYSDHSKDQEYLVAAIKAIRDFSHRKIIIQDFSSSSQEQADWIFWLSDKPFQGKLKPGAQLFQYEQGKPEVINSNLIVKDNQSFGVKLFQKTKASSTFAQNIWTDGFGEPILSLTENKGIRNYHFYTRLNPQWTNLVWSEDFVKSLMHLILAPPNKDGFEISKADQRLIAQNQPFVQQENEKFGSLSLGINQPIDYWFWLFAFAIFLLERILTYQKSKAI